MVSRFSGLFTAVLLALTVSATAEMPLRSDLVETSIAVSQTGGSLRVTDVVANPASRQPVEVILQNWHDLDHDRNRG